MRISAKLIKYLVMEGQIVLPYKGAEKHPWGTDWQNSEGITIKDLQNDGAEWMQNNNMGAGLLPTGNWGWFDIDCDHGTNLNAKEVFKPLVELLGNGDKQRGSQILRSTLIARKPNSSNFHIYFKTPNLPPLKFTGVNAVFPKIEFSNYKAPIRVSDYKFLNLNYSKPFLSNMIELPSHVSELFEQINYEKNKDDLTVNQIKFWEKPKSSDLSNISTNERLSRYLAKVTPPTEGGRHNFYRRLIYTLVKKDGFDYDTVRETLINWDKINGVNQQKLDPDGFFSALTPVN